MDAMAFPLENMEVSADEQHKYRELRVTENTKQEACPHKLQDQERKCQEKRDIEWLSETRAVRARRNISVCEAVKAQGVQPDVITSSTQSNGGDFSVQQKGSPLPDLLPCYV